MAHLKRPATLVFGSGAIVLNDRVLRERSSLQRKKISIRHRTIVPLSQPGPLPTNRRNLRQRILLQVVSVSFGKELNAFLRDYGALFGARLKGRKSK